MANFLFIYFLSAPWLSRQNPIPPRGPTDILSHIKIPSHPDPIQFKRDGITHIFPASTENPKN